MKVKEFDKLRQCDFENGAVLGEIRKELKKAEKWDMTIEIAKQRDMDSKSCLDCAMFSECNDQKTSLCWHAQVLVNTLEKEAKHA